MRQKLYQLLSKDHPAKVMAKANAKAKAKPTIQKNKKEGEKAVKVVKEELLAKDQRAKVMAKAKAKPTIQKKKKNKKEGVKVVKEGEQVVMETVKKEEGEGDGVEETPTKAVAEKERLPNISIKRKA